MPKNTKTHWTRYELDSRKNHQIMKLNIDLYLTIFEIDFSKRTCFGQLENRFNEARNELSEKVEIIQIYNERS